MTKHPTKHKDLVEIHKQIASNHINYIEKIGHVTNNHLEEYIRLLPEKLDKSLKQILLSLLGITEEGWSDKTYKFNNQNGILQTVFKNEVNKIAEEKATAAIRETFEVLCVHSEITKELFNDARKHYRTKIREIIMKHVTDLAIADANQIIAESGIGNIITAIGKWRYAPDIADPTAFDGVLGEKVLEELSKKLI